MSVNPLSRSGGVIKTRDGYVVIVDYSNKPEMTRKDLLNSKTHHTDRLKLESHQNIA